MLLIVWSDIVNAGNILEKATQVLAEKLNLCLANGITPIFCCGEALRTREQNQQNTFVEQQLSESLFHLSADEVF